MIKISKKENCCGCGACLNICGNSSISMQFDEEGFAYPLVNDETCIDCNKCNLVCPLKQTKQIESHTNMPECYVAYAKDSKRIFEGSAGGIFGVLCDTFLQEGGIVYGAYLNENFLVRHGRAASIEEANIHCKSGSMLGTGMPVEMEGRSHKLAEACVCGIRVGSQF